MGDEKNYIHLESSAQNTSEGESYNGRLDFNYTNGGTRLDAVSEAVKNPQGEGFRLSESFFSFSQDAEGKTQSGLFQSIGISQENFNDSPTSSLTFNAGYAGSFDNTRINCGIGIFNKEPSGYFNMRTDSGNNSYMEIKATYAPNNYNVWFGANWSY